MRISKNYLTLIAIEKSALLLPQCGISSVIAGSYFRITGSLSPENWKYLLFLKLS
jgi:hypothetical protein